MGEWQCVPLLILCCRNILEGKDISAVRHIVAEKRPYVRCIVTGDHVNSDEMVCERSVRETKIIGSRFLEIPSNDTKNVEDLNELCQEETDYGQ